VFDIAKKNVEFSSEAFFFLVGSIYGIILKQQDKFLMGFTMNSVKSKADVSRLFPKSAQE